MPKRFVALVIAALSFVFSNGAISADLLQQQRPPFFKISPSEKAVLIENAKMMKVGDSYKEVLRLMGNPTFDQPMARKEDSRITGRKLIYYAVIWEDGLVNEKHDEYVALYFNEADRLKEILIKTLPH